MAVEGRKGRSRLCAKALLALLAAVALSPALGSFTVKMMGISEELEKALLHVLEATDLNYTEPDTNATYISSTVFNPMGMGHLYNVTNAFVDLIQKKQAYPEGAFFHILIWPQSQMTQSSYNSKFTVLFVYFSHYMRKKMKILLVLR